MSTSNRAIVILAAAAGIALIAVGVVYFIDTASSLPGFFPGHQSGSTHHHVKHGIAAVVVGVGALVFAWFRTGPAGAVT